MISYMASSRNSSFLSDTEGDKPASSSSWLGRWWKKESTGPIRANLGEETAFYYDKDLKKWVNKKVAPTRIPASAFLT